MTILNPSLTPLPRIASGGTHDVPDTYASAMQFGFEPFLSKIDPSQKYEIQPLTGGLVNVTVRATNVSGHSSGFFPKHGSLILKYAPPFVAALGESAPFSQGRQVLFSESKSHVPVS